MGEAGVAQTAVGRTWKPSRIAAVRSRSSSETKPLAAGTSRTPFTFAHSDGPAAFGDPRIAVDDPRVAFVSDIH